MTLEELAVLEQTGSLPRREDGIYGLTSQDLLQQSHWEAIRREQAKNVAKYITLPEAVQGLLFGAKRGGSNPRLVDAPQRFYTQYDTPEYLASEAARGALSPKPTYKSPVRTALDKARETVRQKYAFAKDNPLEKVIESVKPKQQDMFLPEQVRLPFGKLSPEAMAERMKREPQLR